MLLKPNKITGTRFQINIYAAVTVFLAYTMIFGFRKSFTVATFDGITVAGYSYKTLLVLSQVLGYMLAKFYGVKYIAELKRSGRGAVIILLTGIAWISWLGFALVPVPYNIVFLFINGFPLGMLWGVVFSYIEGRRGTDFIGATLAVSFIFASGFVRSAGGWLMLAFGVTEFWVPFFTGLLFAAPLLLFIYLMEKIPPPNDADVTDRMARTPMVKTQRRAFVHSLLPGLAACILIYTFATIFRDIRDNFGAEMWKEMGFFNQPAIFSKKQKQQALLNLPLYTTTTIGSFPQTAEVRSWRAQLKKGAITQAQYDLYIARETEKTVKWQEEIDIDVLVHGEFERNDMVEYFGEQLQGFTFTQNGWVQSYGSRCVKPPIIYGDVSRPDAMTVRWSAYAQSLTDKWMKGMLTGPVTILQWSFVRNDQPRSETCSQIALAIRDEVVDLEAAGIKIIQIDEPAIREGLPLRQADWAAYLDWAVKAFRISASGVQDDTQIHTHMCYSEFNDIIQNIADMDADVITIETSRSQMELLDVFADFKYPNEIGPGVYDIHSPRVPNRDEMTYLLKKARAVIPDAQLWVNPDCGLKTRGWDETKLALTEMVAAAKEMRATVTEPATL